MPGLRPMVHTEKHYNQESLFAVGAGAISSRIIADAVAVPATADNQVREGCTISAVYIEMWITSDDDAVPGSSIVTVEKVPGNSPLMTAANSAALNAYENKKNVLHCQMGLTPTKLTYPLATVKGWFKIPKGKQRMGLGDRLLLNIHAQSNGLSACGFFIYKEQY